MLMRMLTLRRLTNPLVFFAVSAAAMFVSAGCLVGHNQAAVDSPFDSQKKNMTEDGVFGLSVVNTKVFEEPQCEWQEQHTCIHGHFQTDRCFVRAAVVIVVCHTCCYKRMPLTTELSKTLQRISATPNSNVFPD